MQTILAELGYDEIPSLLAFNKIDQLGEHDLTELVSVYPGAIGLSALRNIGVEELLVEIDDALPRRGRWWATPGGSPMHSGREAR